MIVTADGKRYYWLKLKDDFFQSKRIKKLRHMAGGDTYTIIYLKMQLLSLRSDGVLQWTGLEENFADELALDLDEKPEDVEVTLMYLLKTGLAETTDNVSFLLPWVLENTGSETASTQRWREWKAKQALETNTTPTLDLLESNTEPTNCQQVANVEKEIDKEIENTDREREREVKQPKKFKPPTFEEVAEYCRERQNKVDAQRFIDYYTANGWKVGRNSMKDWKAAIRTWEKTSFDNKPAQQKKYSTGETYKVPVPQKTMEEIRNIVDMI